MNETFTLKDGTVMNGYVIESDGVLFVYMFETTFQDAFNLLIDPAKTERIDASKGTHEIIYTGYNHLYSVREESNGLVTAGLKKVSL